MELLFLFLLFPLVWAVIATKVWPHKLTSDEIITQLAIVMISVVGLYFFAKWAQTTDIEILNGHVVSKHQERVSCEHSYSCGKDSTCYEHSHDYDWIVQSTAGNFEIDRVNRRGDEEPPRFTAIQIGQSVSLPRRFENVIKATPYSLFNLEQQKTLIGQFPGLPVYPDKGYDYQFVDRVIANGINVPNLKIWNRKLQDTLAPLGPRNQVNAVVVFTNSMSPVYADALRASWLGGKKNDVVVVIGAPSFPNIEWVRVFSWTDVELFKIELRDNIQALKTLDIDPFMTTLSQQIKKNFKRKPWRDFDYLHEEVTPPLWAVILMACFSVIGSIVLSFHFARTQGHPLAFAAVLLSIVGRRRW